MLNIGGKEISKIFLKFLSGSRFWITPGLYLYLTQVYYVIRFNNTKSYINKGINKYLFNIKINYLTFI